jgi:ADP-heptose:LPS heptosyltransferase
MSLPYFLKKNTIEPNVEDYINVNENKLVYWRDTFSASMSKRKKVGFVLNGLLSSFIDKNIPLNEIKMLLDLDIDLICICKIDEVKDKEGFNEVKDRVHFYDIDKDMPFEDTITMLKNIDILITIDTYIVHLAGILNVKTFLLLGYCSEWRWSNIPTSTYWYNSVELIRMRENKELKYILNEVRMKLE